ncbi:hypothetical protein AWC38_SpisGene9998 [Stylophora pistillata]|uniref:Cysteine and tyrosine-rich protein 1 n=1 Tax=Stylophora pistillata TaxID=50429 RepID=A0A2B4SAB2_STYPI|nr:hypothetical protein AWC38_SpisGene9998 [Stylophora pistillata]
MRRKDRLTLLHLTGAYNHEVPQCGTGTDLLQPQHQTFPLTSEVSHVATAMGGADQNHLFGCQGPLPQSFTTSMFSQKLSPLQPSVPQGFPLPPKLIISESPNPFFLVKLKGNISKCNGCEGSFHKDSQSVDSMAVIGRLEVDWYPNLYLDGTKCWKLGRAQGYYHINIACLSTVVPGSIQATCKCGIGEDCCGGLCSSYCKWSGGAIAGAVIGTIIFFAIIISIVSCLCCACCPYYRYRTPGTVVVTQQSQQQFVSTQTHMMTTQQVQPPPPMNYNQPPPGYNPPPQGFNQAPPPYPSYPPPPNQYPPPPGQAQAAPPPTTFNTEQPNKF